MTAPATHAAMAPEDDWPAAFFADADSLDLDRLASWFAPEVDVRFANAPPIVGHGPAREAFAQFWSNITGMAHRREALVLDGPVAIQIADVTYTRMDGSAVILPVASHLRRYGPAMIDRLWIYIDLAPLFAPVAS